MAAICRKPKDCAHPTCQAGECKKCAWNPRSNYPPWHSYEDGVRFSPIVTVLTVLGGIAIAQVLRGGVGAVLFVGIIGVGLFYLFRPKTPDVPI